MLRCDTSNALFVKKCIFLFWSLVNTVMHYLGSFCTRDFPLLAHGIGAAHFAVLHNLSSGSV